MIMKDELLAAYDAAKWNVEQNRVMALHDHDKTCEAGPECGSHFCVMGSFMRALFSTPYVDGFPAPFDLWGFFRAEGLPNLAASVFYIMALNDEGKFDEALRELRKAIG
jgi:hypothetical protein